MEIFDKINSLNRKITEGEKYVADLERAIKDLEKRLESYKTLLDTKNNALNSSYNTLNGLLSFLKTASMFNRDEIGEILAKLISSIEKEDYVYCKSRFIIEEVSTGRYGADTDYDEYDIYIICKSSSAKKIYQASKEYMTNTFFEGAQDILVIMSNNIYANSTNVISFYNNMDRKIDVKKFGYVYDFIDYVINDKRERQIFKVSKEELEMLLEKFLSDYNLDNSVKKIKKE